MGQVRIYLGALIEHASERAVLARLHEQLTMRTEDSVIFANVTLEGRQLDLIAATAGAVLVIEAKGFTRPLTGDFNGVWRITTSAGRSPVNNPYQQALGAKNALRDAMRGASSEDPVYPDAAVVFTPRIPPGSTIPAGDHKVQLIGLEALSIPVPRSGKGRWNLKQWHDFAEKLNLSRVASHYSAVDSKLLNAEQQLRNYAEAFRRTYEHRVAGLVPFACRIEDREVSSPDISALIVGGANGLLMGPSGCGKTLLALRASLDHLAAGGVPIVVEAQHFRGEIKPTLDREAALLGMAAGRDLLSASLQCERPLLCLLDGYNECSPEHRRDLSRAIAALVRRYPAQVLVTSQGCLESGELLNLTTIVVSSPTSELKSTIARAAADRVLSPATCLILDAATSGLEARLVGEASEQLPPSASRYAVFDAYVRKRLGPAAVDAIGFLASVAGWLINRMSFSLSNRELDRLLEAHKRPPTLVSSLSVARLLTQRGDRVSFGHELFLRAFTAEAVVRRAGGDATAVLTAIDAPLYAEARALIIGAIDDDALVLSVLEGVRDRDVLAACVSGDCGRRARTWAYEKLAVLFESITEEARAIRFELDDAGWLQVRAESRIVARSVSSGKALLRAVPTALSTGNWLKHVRMAARAMDESLRAEMARLSPEARERQIPLRTGLFANAYVGQQSNSPALTKICNGLNGMSLRQATTDRLAQEVADALAAPGLTPGELYILLEVGRHTSRAGHPAAPVMAQLLERYWPLAPYHLRLALLEVAGYCWKSPEAVQRAFQTNFSGRLWLW